LRKATRGYAERGLRGEKTAGGGKIAARLVSEVCREGGGTRPVSLTCQGPTVGGGKGD